MLLWRLLLLFVLWRCIHLSCRPRQCPFRDSAVGLCPGHLAMLHLCLAIKCAFQQVASEAGGGGISFRREGLSSDRLCCVFSAGLS
ncbi:hypothetical protein MTO96_017387 [Rhipicephalus appendiculatus]